LIGRLVRSYLYVFQHYPALIGMGVIVIVMQLAWSLVMFVLPLYFKHQLHQSSAIGFVLLAFLGTETLLKPWFGELGDRWGRKPMILAGCAVAMLAMGLCYLPTSSSWWLFLPLMTLNGMAAAAIWPAVTAYMGERVPVHDKAAAMSVFEGGYLVGFGAGGAAGLYLGGVLGNRMLFLIAVVFFLGAMALTAVLVKSGVYREESSKFDEYDTLPEVQSLLQSGVALLREIPMLSRLMFVYVMSQFAVTAMAPIVSLYGVQELGRSQEEMAGLFLGPMMVVAAFGVAMGRLADAIGKVRAVKLCYLVAAGCLVLMFAARAPQPGEVIKLDGKTVTAKRPRRDDMQIGDVLTVRREAESVARVRVSEVEDDRFAAELVSGRPRLGDGVFVKAHAWQIVLLLVSLTLLGLAYALGAPSLLGLGSAVAPQVKQGQALGLMNAAQGVGSCLGVITGPLLYDRVSPQAPIVMAGVMFALCVFYAQARLGELSGVGPSPGGRAASP